MPNITSVTLTGGVPTAGSGNVSTIDNLIGTAGSASAQVQTVQGVTSMTPVQVSQATAASLNATVVGTGTFATQAASTIADGANVAQGAVADSAYVSGSGTVISLLKAINAWVNRIYSSTAPLGHATATATTTLAIGGTYNATPPTFTDTQQGGIQLDSSGKLLANVSNTYLTNFGTGYYKTVAASQTGTVLQSSTGATGDYISGILVIPASLDPGNVLLLDNATSITVFAGGTGSVGSLIPFFIPLGAVSRSGAWKLTTGADVSCVAVGKFS